MSGYLRMVAKGYPRSELIRAAHARSRVMPQAQQPELPMQIQTLWISYSPCSAPFNARGTSSIFSDGPMRYPDRDRPINGYGVTRYFSSRTIHAVDRRHN